MSKVLHHKVVVSLPDPLEPDSIYYVRTGAGFDIYITNGAGVVTAYRLNAQDTVPQTEAEEGTSATRRAWTAERVWQAMAAWWGGVSSVTPAASKAVVSKADGKIDSGFLDAVGTGRVMREGAGGLLGNAILYCIDIDDSTQRGYQYVSVSTAGDKPTVNGIVNTYGYDGDSSIQEFVSIVGGLDSEVQGRYVRNKYASNPWSPWALVFNSSNQLNLGLTPSSARTALGLFTDASGVITNGSGALTNDVSAFLTLNTYADMSVKVQGTHNYAELANNSTSLTPLAGYYYLLPRTTEAALTHTFTCTYSATTVKTWRMLVTRTWTTSTALGPVFSVSGLSGSVIINGVFERANLKALIEFTQIGQNVIGQIVAQWS